MIRTAFFSLFSRLLAWGPLRRRLNARLGFAVRSGDAHSISFLLDLGADPDAELPEGFTPLTLNHTRSDAQCAQIARLLISRGATPDLAHASGSTPLHYAALFGLPELCRTLVNAGADPQTLDDSGLTPAANAARFRPFFSSGTQADSAVDAELDRGLIAPITDPAMPRRPTDRL